MKILSYALAAALVVGILSTGCAKKTVKTETMGEGVQAQTKTNEASVKPTSEQTGQAKPVEEKSVKADEIKTEDVSQGEVKKESALVVEAKTIGDIFFDFDRFSVRDDAKPILEDNGKYLKANKNLHLLIEGHCDERGTSEYNIALGERRAKTAQQYLIDLGIEPSRISIISYGEEKPFCSEHKEQCWQENRRAHFVVK